MKYDELVVYAVPWIEVEFGQRDEGHALFLFKDDCISKTLEASSLGAYDGGYIGPARPLQYMEVPFNSLEEQYQTKLRLKFRCHTKTNWSPRFSGKTIYIKYINK